MTRQLSPQILSQLSALTWVHGPCHVCPSEGPVTEVEDEGYPNAPVTRFCRSCMTLRLESVEVRSVVTAELGVVVAKRAADRMAHAAREREQE